MNERQLGQKLIGIEDAIEALIARIAETEYRVSPSTERFSWLPTQTEQTQSITSTEAVGSLWDVNTPARADQSFIRHQFDSYTGTPIVTSRWWSDNLARSLTPTATGFGAGSPTSPANACDEDTGTSTGAGLTYDTAIDSSYFQIDLGATYDGYFWIDFTTARGGANTVYAAYQHSVNGSDWTTIATESWSASVGRAYYFSTVRLTGKRYLRLSVWNSTATPPNYASMQVHEWAFFKDLWTDSLVMGSTPKVYAHRTSGRPFIVATASSTANCTARYQMHSLVDIK